MLMKSHIYPQAVISILRQFLSFRHLTQGGWRNLRLSPEDFYLLLLTSYFLLVSVISH